MSAEAKHIEHYAAIDLGSNSFHIVVANYEDGRAIVVDRLKEMVRLAGGLDKKNYLSEEAMEKAITCLEKFGQRIKTIPHTNIRAVGTNTLRQAKNGAKFLNRANQALGHQIEIISGREEARLIYLGVANTLYNDTDYRLVIDIGGGSTELIIGKGYRANVTESLFMGCVNISKRFFANGVISDRAMADARIAALQETQNIADSYCTHGWSIAIGASGTIKAILNVCIEQEWTDAAITSDALQKLKQSLLDFGEIDNINFESLSGNRQPVFVGGVIVLSAIFEALQIDEMHYSDGALREGLIHEQIGRHHDYDIREQTVDRISRRYSVDTQQAARLEATAKKIYKVLNASWQHDDRNDEKLLYWAARLHEIGLAVAHTQYHKHGEYILGNADMPGFSKQEQKVLSILVRAHRRRYPIETYNEISDDATRDKLIQLSIVLRLAVVLNRGHQFIDDAIKKIKTEDNVVKLSFKKKWLIDNPLTEADLVSEANYITSINYRLIIKTE
ncbi:MAG: exopolyphosphatase [Pseudomonadota bacterium]